MKSDYPDILGRTIQGKIDRPLGSHHPKYPGTIYPINYGYASDYMSEDGENQDVYLLGPKESVSEFTGRVIAIYRRYDDVEDKWIVTVDDREYSDPEILELIAFQERFFSGKLLRGDDALKQDE